MTAPAHNPTRNNTQRQLQATPFSGQFKPRRFPLSYLSNSPQVRAVLIGGRSRTLFASMLRAAFPGDSDNERAERGAPVLGISTRHFRRLLQCEHDAKVAQVLAVFVLIGFEAAIKITTRQER